MTGKTTVLLGVGQLDQDVLLPNEKRHIVIVPEAKFGNWNYKKNLTINQLSMIITLFVQFFLPSLNKSHYYYKSLIHFSKRLKACQAARPYLRIKLRSGAARQMKAEDLVRCRSDADPI